MDVRAANGPGSFGVAFADVGEFVDVYTRQLLQNDLFLPLDELPDASPGEESAAELRVPGATQSFWVAGRIAELKLGPPRGVRLQIVPLVHELRQALESFITQVLRGEEPTLDLPEAAREHGLPPASDPGTEPEDTELEGAGSESTDEEADRALAFQEEATGKAADGRSIQAQLRDMDHQAKIRLALSGGKAARAALMRNPQPQYHPYVVQNPRITRAELAAIAKNPTLAADVLRMIASNPQHMSDPAVRFAIVKNPKTDPQLAQKYLARLPQSQLRQLARSDDVRPPLKSAAVRLLGRGGR